jgi:uncharacterized membrane protein
VEDEIVPVTEQGKMWAIASHASPFIGFPIWIVPLVLRDDAFAVYHAKQAGIVGIGYFVTFALVFVFAFVTCGFGAFLVPVVFLWWIPAILGLIAALNGKCEPIPVLGGFADMVFGGIQPKAPGER